ncbi:response regulator transcription factor [Paenibacillus sp. 8b26]|uniref:response regulator transcription factor n=1 Tax=Paenibacillus sp. 8b26 TaxID=3424133 RepID=UPI003D65855D
MTGPLIRVILVDDQHLVRHGLRFIINAQEDMEVTGEASGGREAVELAARVRPHVVLMDVQMSEGGGIEATHDIVDAIPDCKVVILTTFDQEDYVYDGIRAGAIFRTAIAARVIGKAIRSAHDFRAPDQIPVTMLPEPFTDRELEVLQQMAYGLRNEEIAARLYIGESTVKTHVHRILQKCAVEDRTQAVVFAIRNGIVK